MDYKRQRQLQRILWEANKILLEEEGQQEESSPKEPSAEEKKKFIKKLQKAVEAGAEETRALLDSDIGRSDWVLGLLNGGLSDGDMSDDVVTFKEDYKPVKDLVPTQGFIDLMQSVAYPLSKPGALEGVVSKGKVKAGDFISIADKYILDGHHRWSGTMAADADAQIAVRIITFPGSQEPGTLLAKSQVAVAAQRSGGKKLPSKGGGADDDIMGKSGADIAKMISDRTGAQSSDENLAGLKILNDEVVEKVLSNPTVYHYYDILENEKALKLEECTGNGFKCPVRKKIIMKVGENLSNMKKQAPNTPASREDMPQLDHKEIGGVEGFKKLRKSAADGEINLVAPFGESVDLSRWGKLAGILKD